jgi:hypothetical protein
MDEPHFRFPAIGIPSWEEVMEKFIAQQEEHRSRVGELLRDAARRFHTDPDFHQRVLSVADFWEDGGRGNGDESFRRAIEAVVVLDALEELS